MLGKKNYFKNSSDIRVGCGSKVYIPLFNYIFVKEQIKLMKKAISFIKSCDGEFCDMISQLSLLAMSTFVIASCLSTLA
jgi:hypothetical protein